MTKSRLFALAAAACLTGAAHARCISNDAWTGPDKKLHFGAGFALGSAGTLAFGKPSQGFLFGTSVGFAKELMDARQGRVCSFQDFAVTALGAAAGAYGTAWIVAPNFIGYARRF